MRIGCLNTLQIARFTQNGAYLCDPHNPHNEESCFVGEKEYKEVLLPQKFLNPQMHLGEMIEVFIYTDSLDRLVATTQKPKALLGEIVALRVVKQEAMGCFLDLGLDKDIFMPTKNPKHYQIDSLAVVHITQDKSGRLIAKLGIKEILKPCTFKNFYPKRVRILPFARSNLGVSCVVEGKFLGLVYEKNALQIGIESIGFVHKVRDDGKIDIHLQSASNVANDAQKIMDLLGVARKNTNQNPNTMGKKVSKKIELERETKNEIGGEILALHYDSSPESIFATLHMSKKAFKRALSALVAQGRVEVVPKVGIKARI
ncbi:S1-like domain-containing RNA-binding protein [Helicobacter fennelliae]|uniref:Uncharacterized protein n=1 Tax=Helicobacter fennelliae TaxID=215 RepID=A0A2X3B654_9HELI|nr:S1-like domain-containing RNA-binding protein [Helicobacter fennelliae]SQB99272.1 Uncharacterised protein [Helicobacter fennelliae]STP08472.1 Uncharacterised protein [Helicobacter fennelliae]